jgi:hypothetical protein
VSVLGGIVGPHDVGRSAAAGGDFVAVVMSPLVGLLRCLHD